MNYGSQKTILTAPKNLILFVINGLIVFDLPIGPILESAELNEKVFGKSIDMDLLEG